MNKPGRRILILFFTIVFLVLKSIASSAENKLTVEVFGQIVCFRNNTLHINAPEAGHLMITVRTKDSIYRIIESDVEAGKNQIEWDGLGFNQEKLYPMSYHIDAALIGLSGTEYHSRLDTNIFNSAQALTLALPSSEILYLTHPEEWFLECKVIRSGTLLIEMIPEDNPESVYSFQRNIEPLTINHLSFREIAGKSQIEPGRYTMRVCEISNPTYSNWFSVYVEEKKPDSLPVTVTGSNMPDANATDAEIWALMQQPAVVVDISNTSHQNVYESPDEHSASLGTIHGQTQTLDVIEINEKWALIEAWNHEEGEKINGWVPLDQLKVVIPNTEYGLLVSKKEQTMSIFHQGKRLDTICVSTGKMEKNKLYQETAAGSFLTGEHRLDYSTNGNRYDFIIQYDGGNLMHQIPYRFGEFKKDFTEGKAILGTKASHACVRLQSDPSDSTGINAYWVWTHIPYHTRLIILDDPEERRAEKAQLLSTPPRSSDAVRLTEKGSTGYPDVVGVNVVKKELPATGGKSSGSSILMTFGGDAVLGGQEWQYSRDDSFPAFLERNGMAYPFSGLQEYFASDDLTSINLECVFKSDSSGEDQTKRWRFRGLPDYAGILQEGSVELVNISNNHTIDYGDSGYQETIRAIDETVAWCGRMSPVAVEIKGHLLGFGGCRETTFKVNPDVIARDIQALKSMGCEYIVYQCHWGKEYDMHFNATQQSMAHACVSAGADLVVGHHPHVVQGIDYIGDVPIIYSLGNLCFGGTINLDERAYDAIIAQAEISFVEKKPETKIRIIPIRTSSQAAEQINDYHPVPARDPDKARILKYVQIDSGVDVPK